MSKPSGPFWVVPTQTNDIQDLRRHVWYYRIGIDDDTTIALITGPDDYAALSLARTVAQALNVERRRLVALANQDEDAE